MHEMSKLETLAFCFPATCTLVNIRAVAADLINAVNAGCQELDLSGIEHTDLSLIQLIVSARRSAANRNLPLRFHSANNKVVAAFERAGVPLPATA